MSKPGEVMNPRELNFKIYGMDCAEEVSILKREIGPLVGGAEHLAFDILNAKMTVLPTAPSVEPRRIIEAVNRSGMRAEPYESAQPAAGEVSFWRRRGRTIMTTASGVFSAGGFLAHTVITGSFLAALGSEGLGIGHDVPLISRGLYAAGVIAGAWYVAPRGWIALRRLRPDMNLLMTIAVIGAVAIGEWFEASAVSFLFALSLALESWSIGRAKRAVEALLELAPASVRILQDGVETEMPPADAVVGDHFLVRPGERIALDGTVVRGNSDVNQAPITGESLPVPKEPGSQVFAGTVNGNGVLEVEVTKLAGETTLAQIIRMVGEAQRRRAPSEQWVDRFAHYYTPSVFALAILVATVPPLAFGAPSAEWVYRALVLLVIGCPCALVISTPVSIVASLAAAARQGVLVKGGVHMETPAKLKAVAFDKTGTLTHGSPSVVDVLPMNEHTGEELLEIAAAIESHSDHPLAHAITTYARARGITVREPHDLQTVQGKGITARVDGRPYWLGSHRYLEERGQETPEVHARLDSLAQSGKTIVAVGTDDHVCGLISLADTVRPESPAIIEALRGAGIEHVIILTGDNRGTAEAVAHETGVDEVRAELLPHEKVLAVEELVRHYGTVAMVGDGINDAPALGRATLGIAMGGGGTDAAIEAGDVALMSDDISKLPWLVRHSQRTLSIIRQNIGLSLAVKLLFAVLTALGYASLWAAIAADMGVSLVVIANALRLLRLRL